MSLCDSRLFTGTEIASSAQAGCSLEGVRTEVFQVGDGRFNTSSAPVNVSIFQLEGKCSLMQTALGL